MEFEINAFVFLKDENDEAKKTRVPLGNIKFEAKNQAEANRVVHDLAIPLIPTHLKERAQGVGYEWVKGGLKQADEEKPKALVTPPSLLSSPVLGSALPYGLKEAPDDASR